MSDNVDCPCGCGGAVPAECIRCKRDYASFDECDNPMASTLITLTPVALPDRNFAAVLCDRCSREVVEFVRPDLKADPGYQARMDQYDAAVRDHKRAYGGD